VQNWCFAMADSKDTTLRAALLTQPRASLEVTGLPPPVRAFLKEFEGAVAIEVRRVLVGGVAYFEVLVTHENLDDESDQDTFVAGTIVDSQARELVDLDFEKRLATFSPSASEKTHNAALTAFMQATFTDARLPTLEAIDVPAKLKTDAGEARAHRVEFEGRPYFALVSGQRGAFEVLIYDAAFNGLGGSYQVGKEPFDVAELEATRPIGKVPLAATSKGKSAVDDFEAPKTRKVTF
jgi:hypothetical protein